MNRVGTIAFKATADVASKISTLAITVVAAHRLSHAAFGELALASTIGWMLGLASDAGVQLHVAREVARAPGQSAVILRRWSGLKRALAASAALAVVLIGVRRDGGELATGRILVGLAYVVLAQVEFLHHVLRGLSRTDVESSILIGARGATLLGAVLVLLVHPRLDLLGIALLVPALVSLGVSARLVGRISRPAPAPAATPAPLRAEFLRDVLPIGAGIVLSALYFRIDVFLVDRWLGVNAVALYTAVFRLVEALRLFPAAVLAVMLPDMCRARGPGTLARIGAAMGLPALAAAAALHATAPWVVSLLYGAGYASAAPALAVLALALPLLTLNYALTQQLIAWGGEARFAAASAGALVVNVALNAALIPARGVTGAAWATVGTEVFLTAACAAGLAARWPRRDAGLRAIDSVRSHG